MSLAALRPVHYWLLRHRHGWRATLVSSVVAPVLFLAAMGLGLGSLVDRGTGSGHLDGVPYLEFLAPGMLAANAMLTAAAEATYPVRGAHKWMYSYHAMLATPLGPTQVLLGHLAWMLLRLTQVAAAFFVAMLAFGTVHRASALWAVPAAVLTGAAFATSITAFTISLKQELGVAALLRFGITPMFLFSGAFFPVEQLPALLRPLAYLTPVWHGVQLCRELTLGTGSLPALLGHTGYLLAWTGGGFWLARRQFAAVLVR